MSPTKSLENRRILVVGGAGLLGKEFCGELINSGARVIAADLNLLGLNNLKLAIPELFVLELDITSESSLVEGMSKIKETIGLLDGIVVSTGIDPKVSTEESNLFTKLEDFPLKQWEVEVASGLTGPFLLLKHCSDLLTKGSSVVLISSDLSVISPDQRLYNLGKSEFTNFKPITYSAIKSGLVGIVKYLSTYWAPRNIRVNSLSPGGVANGQPENFIKELQTRIPLGRLAQKDEYNKAVTFLLSEDSRYMTGQNLVIDGGRSVW
jgi:NAD(P)-dependent dehydrogenase (short-subunit alcohol dehydrogenase family)